MCRAGRPVHEERLVGRIGAMLAHPGDRLVGQVLAQMIFLIMGRLDRIEVLEQPRLPLRGLAGEEAVEVVEADALAGWPERERPHRRGFGRRRVVPLAEGRSLISVIAKHLGDGRGRPGNDAGIAIPVHRALGDGAGTHALVISAGQQRRARRRADRGRVEGVVADAVIRDPRKRRRVDWTAIGIGQAEANVIEEDDQDVGRVLRQVVRLRPPLMRRILKPRRSDACRRDRREWEHGTVIWISRGGNG